MCADRDGDRLADVVGTPEHPARGRQDEMSEERRSAGFFNVGSTADPGAPRAHGLYDPALDKDSCGVGFIADIKGRKSHQLIEDGLRILCNLEHRGAVGLDRMVTRLWR